jgi:hypothetical protein
MGALDIETALDWRGRTVFDRDGEKIGTLREIYLDEHERPAWGSVHTGLFGLRETFVPLAEVQALEDDLQVPYTQEQVKDAPSVDPDVQLSPEEEEQLYSHYRVDEGAEEVAQTDDDDAMTRSEEEVEIGTRQRVRGRARLKKYVVTDYVEKKVPVRREEVRLEQEPAADDESQSDPPR